MNRKPFLFALVTMVTFGFSACRAQDVDGVTGATSVAAENSRTFKVESFSTIELSGVSTIHFTQGEKTSVMAKGRNSQLDALKIYTKDGCLYISNKSGSYQRNGEGCDLYISTPTLTGLKVSGVGTFLAKKVKTPNFTLRLSGVATFDVDQLQSDDTHITISGVGNVSTTVEGDNLYLKTSGVGTTKVNFKGKSADVINSGVGHTTVSVDCDEVTARNSGESTLTLKGHADKTNIDNSGVATVDTSELNNY